MATKPQTKPAGKGTVAPVSGATVQGQPAASAAPGNAVETAIRHGGNAGGKPRTDGLTPGSPQAAAADRDKDAARKRAARAVAQQLKPEPPALPSAPATGATTPPPGGQAAVPGPGQPATPVIVPWDPATIKPLIEKMIEAAEKGRLAKFAVRCQQLGDMPKLIKEIEEDAYFPPEAKAMLVVSLPRCAAKWLNKSGISAEYQDEIAILTACVLIWSHTRKADERLAKALAALEKAKDKKPAAQQQIFGAAPGVAGPGPAVEARGFAIPEGRPAPKGAPPEVNLAQGQPIATVKQ